MVSAEYALKSDELEVHVSTWGATITRMIVPDKQGRPVDVVLGMDNPEDYRTQAYMASGAYLGALVGRYANRIARGEFTLDGQHYRLAINNSPNHLHGGVCGFDKKIWKVVSVDAQTLVLQYDSPDGEEHYPGNMTVRVTFIVKGKELRIEYRAVVDKPCYVNLTHHPYFNLNPERNDIRSHFLKLYSRKYLKTDHLIPDGTILLAEGDYDFSEPVALEQVISHQGGLDDCFVYDDGKTLQRRAELFEKETGITLYVASDYPGLQVYTGKYLNVKDARQGRCYGAYAGVALEAQYFPDSPNHPEFPSTLLRPGEEYVKTTVYGYE